ncbi:hypothetical protein JHN59_08630 [Streptomyces sp. MBT49]|uniref:hypothetical protein n=1 Tax=unclassified Streptomyces TaxID=2593676 RepID=UPI00190AE2F1|nr:MULTISPECIES: hypothetical protein [unclassified Streptomyces]MBK3624912.1 hypothetical protein [Streptomyces sp. MBT49]MBK3632556.1 hypothetical protein [Streptomyces sp. MBT97]
MPRVPYVSAAAFRAYPTYLDTQGINLASSDPDAQTAQLTDLLLKASAWADAERDQPLGAHLHTQHERVFSGRDGLLRLHADHGPVIEVVSVGYGYSPGALTVLDAPTVWVEDDTNMVLSLGSTGSVAWSGSLSFGSPAVGGDVFVQASYVAGHVATVLDANAGQAATVIQVQDPTGIVPGGTYRICDPGSEELIVVDPGWTPPTPSSTPLPVAVTLAEPLAFAHEAGHDVTRLPEDLRLAVVQHTTAQLLKPDTTAEDEYPDGASSSTRADDSRTRGMGLLKEARRTLASYGRVR